MCMHAHTFCCVVFLLSLSHPSRSHFLFGGEGKLLLPCHKFVATRNLLYFYFSLPKSHQI